MRRTLTAVLSACLGAALLVASPSATETAAEPAAEPVASKFTPLTPVRVLDIQTGAGRTSTVDLSARVPATATAVVLNVAGVAPTMPTFVTAFPSGTTRPDSAHLNLVPRRTGRTR